MSNPEAQTGVKSCPSCSNEASEDAKFCPECGAAMDGSKPPAEAVTEIGAKTTAGAIANQVVKGGLLATLTSPPVLMAAIVGAGIFALGFFVSGQNWRGGAPAFNRMPATTPPLSMGQPAQMGQTGQAGAQQSASRVDLSTMTPREAADRLFNRVMAADERGDTAEATRFAPMAVQAYGMVQNKDADAFFHVGLINLVLGDKDGVQQQIAKLKGVSADHLLAMALAIKLAKLNGDNKKADEILARFAKVYNMELAGNRPEYQAHKVTIDKLIAAAPKS